MKKLFIVLLLALFSIVSYSQEGEMSDYEKYRAAQDAERFETHENVFCSIRSRLLHRESLSPCIVRSFALDLLASLAFAPQTAGRVVAVDFVAPARLR